MKHFLFAIIFFTTANCVVGQGKLSKSRETGYHTYIYRLTDEESLGIALKSKSSINDSFLHTLVDSFYFDSKVQYKGKLPYGNYLYVTAVKNQLLYRLETVQNIRLNFINDLKNIQLSLTDLNGNQITDAKVTIGKHKNINYDPDAHLYLTKSAPKQKIIRVDYHGVINYFNFQYAYSWYNRTDRKRFEPQKIQEPDYKGYLVFNKPRYKPLDTVKFKTYLVDKQAKLIKNKVFRVDLYDSDEVDEEPDNHNFKTLGTVTPYKDGGYTFNFVIADSLDLDLDEHYSIVLKEFKNNRWVHVIKGEFKYEDYELKSINFSTRTDKAVQSAGSPISVYMVAKDENDLAVPDGRVVITAIARNPYNYRSNHVFVPDTLWKKEMVLEPTGETKLVLPERMFPKADLEFILYFDFLNSNNESQHDSKYLSYVYKSSKIRSSLQNDSLKVVYLINENPEIQKASLISYQQDGEKLDSLAVEFPLLLKLNPRIIKYQVIAKDGFKDEIDLASLQPGLQVSAQHTKDSLQVHVTNPQNLPFWYTIFSGNKIIEKSYARKLDKMIKHNGNKAAHIRINYVWAGKAFSNEVSSAYFENLIDFKLAAPDMVYPGQQIKMEVKLTGADQKPVPFTDVTAYSFTSKFKDAPYAELPDFNKEYSIRKQSEQIETVELQTTGQMVLNWQKMGKALNLDTISYYQFSHPKELYIITEPGKDTLTQIAPFIMKNGDIQPVHVVYIDEVPVFFSKTDQLQRYSFVVSPGKHHIRLRTANQMITLQSVDILKGKKTILSIEGGAPNSKASILPAPAELTVYECELLGKYLLNVQDNFKEEKAILLADDDKYLLNPLTTFWSIGTRLIGPIAQNRLSFQSGKVKASFIKEPGYTYTFTNGMIRQKSNNTEYGFQRNLTQGIKKQSDNYKEYALSKNEIDSLWDEYLNLRSYTTNLFTTYISKKPSTGELIMALDTAFSTKMPYVKNILIYKSDSPEYGQIYPGNFSGHNIIIDTGVYKVLYLFKDNRYFIEKNVVVEANGKNYYKWINPQIMAADQLSIKTDGFIKSVKLNKYDYQEDVRTKVLELFNETYFNKDLLTDKVRGKVVDDNNEALPGVGIRVKGLMAGTTTNSRGEFELSIPKKGTLLISFIGFINKEVPITSADLGVIRLSVSGNDLQEVVVTAFAVQKENRLLASSVAGVQIRGNSTLSAPSKPIIIVDGMPFSGELSQIEPGIIAKMEILKGAEASAIYGSRGANGVIIISTKAGNLAANSNGILVPQTQTLRNNFSDYGFWQPQLSTNSDGIASWTVKFPDDITSWSGRIIAMNGNKQAGQSQFTIKAFKSLSANFVSPQFALEGDSINVIGKLMNYTVAAEKVLRKFVYNGKELKNDAIQFKNSYIDTIPVIARGADSLSFKYTLEQDNGYFDGELRKIPVLSAGVIETRGYFDVLSNDTTINYNFPIAGGRVTLRAEASVFPVLLDEMEKLRKYEYLCNEQLASKLKSLLLEKTVRAYLNEPFKHDKDIKDLIKKLQSVKRKEGTWGWWQDSNEEMWISLHAVESLLMAEKQGYAIVINKEELYRYLIAKLANDNINDNPVAIVRLINLIKSDSYIKDWVAKVARAQGQRNQRVKLSLYENLSLMQLEQLAGNQVDQASLLSLCKTTMFGNIYWGEENNRFWDNSIQNTLLAYQILKAGGKHQQELELIRGYFLEQRKDGQWRNTYESSLILETILPDLLLINTKSEAISLVINKSETIKEFPFTKIMESSTPVTITKKGNLPIYFTAYQQYLNPKPEKVSKDFTVKTTFYQKELVVTKLKAGLSAKLKVEVLVRADADYVMIEVPIPAGCSYENKKQNLWGVEVHREYFKHKTSIFCSKLKAGKYNFEIELMPRYSGNYLLNPAKAEMMYFPVFFGREGMKRVAIN